MPHIVLIYFIEEKNNRDPKWLETEDGETFLSADIIRTLNDTMASFAGGKSSPSGAASSGNLQVK